VTRLIRASAAAILAAGFIAALPATASAAPTLQITGGHIKIKLNAAALSALSSAHLKLTPKSPATFNGTTLKAPIKGGTIDIATVTAHIKSAGGFTISKGSKSVTVKALHSTAHGGAGGSGTALVTGHGRIKAITTTAATVSSGSGSISAKNFKVTLAAPLVKILDKKFHTTVFADHARIGTGSATMTAH